MNTIMSRGWKGAGSIKMRNQIKNRKYGNIVQKEKKRKWKRNENKNMQQTQVKVEIKVMNTVQQRIEDSIAK